MPGAINIAPLVESVDIRGQKLLVNGLEAETLIGLFAEFDDLRRMWDTRKFDLAAFKKLSKPAVAYVIAACVEDEEGNCLDRMNAANLTLGERAEILAKIARISAPRGIGPFMDLMALVVGGDPSSMPPDTKSSKQSKNSLRPGIETPGTIPRDNSKDGSISAPSGAGAN
jgi:hypothetical protein